MVFRRYAFFDVLSNASFWYRLFCNPKIGTCVFDAWHLDCDRVVAGGSWCSMRLLVDFAAVCRAVRSARLSPPYSLHVVAFVVAAVWM